MIKTKEIGRIIEVCSKNQMVAGEEISYRLIRLEADFSLYLLIVSDSKEEASVLLGGEAECAKNVFDAFWIGEVSPCTANDIFKDIFLS